MNKIDWKKILTGAAIAIGGALLSYVSSEVIPSLRESGDATLLAVAAFASVAINIARKYLEGSSSEID